MGGAVDVTVAVTLAVNVVVAVTEAVTVAVTISRKAGVTICGYCSRECSQNSRINCSCYIAIQQTTSL